MLKNNILIVIIVGLVVILGFNKVVLAKQSTENLILQTSETNSWVSDDCIGLPYLSTYENIQWGCMGNDFFYCIDIFDNNWNMLYQAVSCNNGLHGYVPQNLNLSPGSYKWKVWSQSGYGEDGFWGQFSVGGSCTALDYKSSYEKIQWGCRNDDSFYCIDIFDSNWNMLYQAAYCGDGLHSYFPNTLNLSPGNYNWKVWSKSGYGGNGFEGQFSVGGSCIALDYKSSYEKIQWGCRSDDSFYCIDIFDNNFRMLYQAASCGEGLHSYSPQSLNLSSGNYNWKVWSKSGYGENGFSGYFSVSANFAGIYEGTFSGDDYGTFRITISDDGYISGTAYSEKYYEIEYVEGYVDLSGDFSVSGSSSDGATFVGRISSNKISGSWKNRYYNMSGTCSGIKK